MPRTLDIRYALVTAFSIAILYGSTYQQFRFFSLADPGGAADALHYVRIAQGEPRITAPENHDFRWITPLAARLVRPLTGVVTSDPELSIKLAFYLVNFSFSLVTCVVMFAMLQAMGYPVLLAWLGVCAFASSRITVLATATPLADAAYFCAIAVIVFLIVAKKTRTLALLIPILVLTKETTIPFLLLPLLTDMRKSLAIWASLAVAAAAYFVSGEIVASYYANAGEPLIATVRDHLGEFAPGRLLTLSGVHDLQNGFSLLLPLAAAGAWLNARHRYHDVPLAVTATIPIATGPRDALRQSRADVLRGLPCCDRLRADRGGARHLWRCRPRRAGMSL